MSKKPSRADDARHLDQKSQASATDTPATMLAAAQDLVRFLKHWHIDDRSLPAESEGAALVARKRWLSFQEAEHEVQKTFRHLLRPSGPRPVKLVVDDAKQNTALFVDPEVFYRMALRLAKERRGDERTTVQYEKRLTNTELALWELRRFNERIHALRDKPPWEHLALAFDRLLDERCFTRREPRWGELCFSTQKTWVLTGALVDQDVLTALVDAAKLVVQLWPEKARKKTAGARGAPLKYPQAIQYAIELLDEGKDKDRVIYRRCKEQFGDVEQLPNCTSFMRRVRHHRQERDENDEMNSII
jgi:hypothetical protein